MSLLATQRADAWSSSQPFPLVTTGSPSRHAGSPPRSLQSGPRLNPATSKLFITPKKINLNQKLGNKRRHDDAERSDRIAKQLRTSIERPKTSTEQPPLANQARPSHAQTAAPPTKPPAGPKLDHKKAPKWTLQEEVRLRKLILRKAGLDSAKASLTDLKPLGDPKILAADNLYWRQIEADFSALHGPEITTSRSYVALYVRYVKELLPRDVAASKKKREEIASTSDLPAEAVQEVPTTNSLRSKLDVDSTSHTQATAASPSAAGSAGRAELRHAVAPPLTARPPATSTAVLLSDTDESATRHHHLADRLAAESSVCKAFRCAAETTNISRPSPPKTAPTIRTKPTLPSISTVTALVQQPLSKMSGRESDRFEPAVPARTPALEARVASPAQSVRTESAHGGSAPSDTAPPGQRHLDGISTILTSSSNASRPSIPIPMFRNSSIPGTLPPHRHPDTTSHSHLAQWDAFVAHMARCGVPIEQIARIFGSSASAVLDVLCRSGFHTPHMEPSTAVVPPFQHAAAPSVPPQQPRSATLPSLQLMRNLESTLGRGASVPSQRRFSLPPPYTGRTRSVPQSPLAGSNFPAAQIDTPSQDTDPSRRASAPLALATTTSPNPLQLSPPPSPPPRSKSDLKDVQHGTARRLPLLEPQAESWRSFDRGMRGLKRFLALRNGEKGLGEDKERSAL